MAAKKKAIAAWEVTRRSGRGLWRSLGEFATLRRDAPLDFRGASSVITIACPSTRASPRS